MNGSLPGWIALTQWASRAVLLILLGLSFWSVAIMIDRHRIFKSSTKPTPDGDRFAEARKLIAARNWSALQVWAKAASETSDASFAERLPAGALNAALSTGEPGQGSPENVDRAVRSYLLMERSRLEHGLTTLATLGSNAPFIGLFGTVLGIIQAFGSLAAQSSSSNSVMTGISEALVATAIGLFVAIPAVVAYNVFSRKMKLVLAECDSLRDFYLSRWTSAGNGNRHGS